MQATEIDRLCKERVWSRARLMLELRRVARLRRVQLPADESLRRMIREWASGRRGISELYAELLSAAFGVAIHAADQPDEGEGSAALAERLSQVESSLDPGLILLFEGQTQSFRVLDRRIGAGRLLIQTEAHIGQMTDLLRYALPGPLRASLAAAVAEAASLAGWQALDLGRSEKAWSFYEIAKHAALDSGSSAILAHVTAESAYALVEMNRPLDAYAVIRSTRGESWSRLPRILQSWLCAAQAETAAASGRSVDALRALDEAERLLPDSEQDDLPFISLDRSHLARWRGNCLARIGHREAVQSICGAVDSHDPNFTRAGAGLYCDLALAHATRGELDAAYASAREAERLASAASSLRQKRRISQILAQVRDARI